MKKLFIALGTGALMASSFLLVDRGAEAANCVTEITGHWSGAYGTREAPTGSIEVDIQKPSWSQTITATDNLNQVFEGTMSCNFFQGVDFDGTINEAGTEIVGSFQDLTYFLDRQPEPDVTVSVADASVVEPDADGVITLNFPVTLTRQLTNDASVSYEIVRHDADRQDIRVDFDVDKVVRFNVSNSGFTPVQRNIAVRVWGDSLTEGDETFEINLLSASGVPGGIGNDVAIGTVIDND